MCELSEKALSGPLSRFKCGDNKHPSLHGFGPLSPLFPRKQSLKAYQEKSGAQADKPLLQLRKEAGHASAELGLHLRTWHSFTYYIPG